MPIRPIDLQTMFLQLGQVGKDQSVEKEGAAFTASMKNAADLKRHEERLESVQRTEDPDSGAREVADRDGNSQGGAASGDKDGKKGSEGNGLPKSEVIRDPGLGKKIDLSG
ncbi:MAG: hypothetical protein ACOYM2_07065 [Rectinemataceae bacterium]